MTTLAAVGMKFLDIIVSYITKRGLDSLFVNNEDFKNRLTDVINKTVRDYMELYPVKDVDGMHSFCKSQRIIDELLKYRIMRDEYNFSELEVAFDSESKVIPPKKIEIENFYEIFLKNVNSDEKLRRLEISETFGNEVFMISRKLDKLNCSIENLISEIHTDLELEWKRQITVYKDTINSFKPKTALNLLLDLEKGFDLSTKKPKDSIYATIEYLKGQCYDFLLESDKAQKSYIKAYRLEPTSKVFKERACFTYYQINDKEKANKILEELLDIDEYNSMAWAVKILISENNDLYALIDPIPEFVRKDFIFRRILYFNTCTNIKYTGQFEVYHKYSIIPDISEYDGTSITINNYKDKIFWVDCKLSEYFRSFTIDYEGNNKGDIQLLEFINQLTAQIELSFAKSEISDHYISFNFFNKYTQFVLTGNKDLVYEMRNIYPKIENKNSFHLLILANSLQIIGDVKSALEIIDGQKNKEIETLYLKAHCFFKQNDIDNYILVVKDLFPLIVDVDLISFNNLFSLLYIIYVNGKQNEFDLDKSLENINFQHPCLRILIESFICIINRNYDAKTIENLRKIENEILEFQSNISFFVIYSYYIIDEFDLAVAFSRKYVSLEFESRDLFYYIISLYKLKTNHKELLRILEIWRKSFSFNDELLRIEADLRRQLSDWENCLVISEYYNSTQGNDESFLTLELIALNELERDYKKTRLFELVEIFSTLEFKNYIHIQIVSNILIQNGFYKIALELLYKKAIDHGNIQARMDYFSSIIRTPKDFIKEKETVELGDYVKYSLSHEVKFIFIDEQNPLAKELVGRSIGEIVNVKRPIVGLLDSIQILRIMDKFLYLHDEILEDARTNPYSGLKMQSIEFSDPSPEGMLESLKAIFGAEGTMLRETIDNKFKDYYDNKLSFSELVSQNYSSDYIGGYFHLVNEKDGVTQIPLFFFPSLNGDIKNEYVIDFSSLLILYQIYKKHKIHYNHKFIISNSIVDVIKNDLKKESIEPKEKMSLAITHEKVIPTKYPENAKENNISYFKGLLEWIQLNCKVIIAESKLDVVRKFERSDGNDAFFNYFIDNVSLIMDSQNRVLISDDSIYFKLYPINSGKIISSEFYLRNNSTDVRFISEFIENKYIGFTVTSEILFSEFNKYLKGQTNKYHHCLTNNALRIIPHMTTILTTIRFLKLIALDSLLTDGIFKQEVINALVNLLRGHGDVKSFRITELTIRKEFALLGGKLEIMLESYSDALQIIGIRKL